MKNFYREGRGLPLSEYITLLKSISIYKIRNTKDEDNDEDLCSDDLEGYTSYLATQIYEHQMRLKVELENRVEWNSDHIGSFENFRCFFQKLDEILLQRLKPIFYSFLLFALTTINGEVWAQPENEKAKVVVSNKSNDDLAGMIHTEIIDPTKQPFMKINPKADLDKFPLKKYRVDSSFNYRAIQGMPIDAIILDMPIRVLSAEGFIQHTTLRKLTYKDYLVLDFWARWCTPCVESMNHWEHMYNSIDDHIQVVGVHLDFDYKVPIETKIRGWRLPQIIGPEAYILNQYFLGVSTMGPSVWIKGNNFFGVSKAGMADHNYVFKILDGTYESIPSEAQYIMNDSQKQ